MAFKTAKLLKEAIRYRLIVTSVKFKKNMTNGDATYYIFLIDFTDQARNMYTAEYFSPTAQQDFFTEGSDAIFDVVKEDTVRSIIAPVMGVTQEGEYELRKSFLRPCGQETYTFAASYARDLVVKNCEIEGRSITDDDIVKMLVWTRKINSGLEEFQKERILEL